MCSKPILKNKGFTFLELVIVSGIALVVFTYITLSINPAEQKQKARDQRRLADLIIYQEAFEEFKADNKIYPDISGEIRYSNVLPLSSTNLAVSSSGWIIENMERYMTNFPLDPLNNDEYFYTYTRNDVDYEFNIKLEYYTDKMSNDGGSDNNLYEVGDNLTLL